MSWTDERIEQLRSMWEKGLTASQIADELGGVSRNAVIGKAHRLGLKSRPSPVKATEKAARPVKAAAPKPATPAAAPRPVAPAAPRPVAAAPKPACSDGRLPARRSSRCAAACRHRQAASSLAECRRAAVDGRHADDPAQGESADQREGVTVVEKHRRATERTEPEKWSTGGRAENS